MQKFTNAMANTVIDKYIIEELEKIKKEIKEEMILCDTDCEFMERYGMQTTVNIIDKHIAELKEGEKE